MTSRVTIQPYFTSRLAHKDIAALLPRRHSYVISDRGLKRVLKLWFVFAAQFLSSAHDKPLIFVLITFMSLKVRAPKELEETPQETPINQSFSLVSPLHSKENSSC